MEQWNALVVGMGFLLTSGLGTVIWKLIQALFKIQELEREVISLKEKREKDKERHVHLEARIFEAIKEQSNKINEISQKITELSTEFRLRNSL